MQTFEIPFHNENLIEAKDGKTENYKGKPFLSYKFIPNSILQYFHFFFARHLKGQMNKLRVNISEYSILLPL